MCTPSSLMAGSEVAARMWADRKAAGTGTQQYGLIVDAARQNYEAVGARGRQTRRSIKEKIGERAEQAQKELGRINAVLADSNLKGGSAERLRNEVLFNESQEVATLQENAFQASEQTRREMRAIQTDTDSRLRSVSFSSVFGSALFGAERGMVIAKDLKGPGKKDG